MYVDEQPPRLEVAPFLEHTELHLEEVTLKTALFNDHNIPGPSIYRKRPSSEVDAAWTYLHKGNRNHLISAEEVRRLRKDPDVAIRAPEE